MKPPFTTEVLALIAARFKALGEPARLEILQALRRGDRTVTELIAETGLGQTNVSKHLQQLLALGFVRRRKEGLYAYYGLADKRVLKMCELMCGRIEAEARTRTRALAS